VSTVLGFFFVNLINIMFIILQLVYIYSVLTAQKAHFDKKIKLFLFFSKKLLTNPQNGAKLFYIKTKEPKVMFSTAYAFAYFYFYYYYEE
jgi:hypothetical protein